MEETENDKWAKEIDEAFRKADMPDVPGVIREAGSYSNAQLIDMFNDNPQELIKLLGMFSGADSATRRGAVSLAADLWRSPKPNRLNSLWPEPKHISVQK